MDVNKPRDIEREEEQDVKITRWKVGPKTDISYIAMPVYFDSVDDWKRAMKRKSCRVI